MGSRKLVAFLWIAFLARGVFYCSLLPLWEGFDEWAHFAVVQNMATRNARSVDRQDPVSREVLESLRLAPRPWGESRDAAAHSVPYDDFWRLPASDRLSIEARLRSLPPEWSRQVPASGVRAYEAQQAPLYYWLLSLAYRPMAGLPLLSRVWLLRLITLAFASFTVPLTFVLARRVLASDALAVGVTAIVVSMPGLMMLCCRIGNDGLAVPLGTLCLLLMLECADSKAPRRIAPLLGAALGCALLTKAYFLALLPALLIYAAYASIRSQAPRAAVARGWASAFSIAALVADWWYWLTWRATGSLSGEQLEAAAGRNAPLSAILGMVVSIHWRVPADFAFVTFIWVGNWSFLVVRGWMYHLLGWIAAAAAVGVVVRVVRPGPYRRSDLVGLVLVFVAMLSALAYHMVTTFAATGQAGTLGHYLYGVIAAEAVLAAAGLAAILPRRSEPFVAPGLALLFAALDVYGTQFYLAPYYTGMIVHSAAGKLETAHAGDLLRNAGLILERAAENKADMLTPGSMFSLWMLYFAATVAVVVCAFWFRRHRSER